MHPAILGRLAVRHIRELTAEASDARRVQQVRRAQRWHGSVRLRRSGRRHTRRLNCALNTRAPFFIIQRALPLLSDGGRIINISSADARIAITRELAYSMAKGAGYY